MNKQEEQGMITVVLFAVWWLVVLALIAWEFIAH